MRRPWLALLLLAGAARAERPPIGPTATVGVVCLDGASCLFAARGGVELWLGELYGGGLVGGGVTGWNAGVDLGTGYTDFHVRPRTPRVRAAMALRLTVEVSGLPGLFAVTNVYAPNLWIRVGAHVAVLLRPAIGWSALEDARSAWRFRFAADVRAGVALLF